MGDVYPVVRVAAVQAASVYLDREASTAKACALIREAGREGAQLIVFPEGFIPAHPLWYHHHVATGTKSMQMAAELFLNSVEIPSRETDALGEAAAEAGAIVVMGLCEKPVGMMGTMYNSQLFIGSDGEIIAKHRKFMPTVGERLVHAGGFGDTFGAFPTEFGPMSALVCGENSNPLAICALAAEGSRIHAMSWPAYLGPQSVPLKEIVAMKSRAFAGMAGCFVVSACAALDDATLQALELSGEEEARLRDPGFAGGSVIIDPRGRVLAGPLTGQEGILYADCDLAEMVKVKLTQDFVGHYNRPDIFQLYVNKDGPELYARYTTQREDGDE